MQRHKKITLDNITFPRLLANRLIITLANCIFISQFTFSQNSLDEFEYHYPDGSNRLTHIDDAVNSSSITSDIEDQSDNNYEYNALGQLTHDEAEGIETIEWEVGGKVLSVTKTDGSTLSFTYDAMGNRVVKIHTTHSSQLTTYYLRDAKGNLIAGYEQENSGAINLKEFPMYGASQLGIFSTSIDHSSSLSNDSTYTRELGSKSYELKDHLGNVRTVITDIKNSTLDASNNPGNFSADIASTADYYSYGMQMLGRTYQSSNYKYGYQGKEKDDELKGDGNSYDFDARILDPRSGRWLTVDPLADQFSSESPYYTMGGDPINNIDLDGKEWKMVRTVDADGNVHFENTLTVAVWNESGKDLDQTVSFYDEETGEAYTTTIKLEQAIKSGIENSYSGEEVAPDGRRTTWTTTVQIRTINSLEERNEGEHVIQIWDVEDMYVGHESSGEAALGGLDAFIFVNNNNNDLKSDVMTVYTIPHELGHTAGLNHDFSKPNIMSYDGPFRGTRGYLLGGPELQPTALQIGAMYVSYLRGELNNPLSDIQKKNKIRDQIDPDN